MGRSSPGRPLRLIGADNRVEAVVREYGPLSAHEVAEKMNETGFRWPVPDRDSWWPGREPTPEKTVRVTASHVRGSIMKNWRLRAVRESRRPILWEWWEP